jgi:hypothetical protein
VTRVLVVLALVAVCAGCTTFARFGAKPQPRSEALTMTERAEQLARDGQASAARDVFARVAAESARDAVHARALHGLARLHVDPRGGLRDYRAAHALYRRLLAEYPGGEWEAEARAWDAVLTDLAAREADLTARDAEVARLRNEAARIGADLQRLKRIDLNLERRR